MIARTHDFHNVTLVESVGCAGLALPFSRGDRRSVCTQSRPRGRGNRPPCDHPHYHPPHYSCLRAEQTMKSSNRRESTSAVRCLPRRSPLVTFCLR